MQHCKTGFTLIELLVVIAIIAILAAILFPVFARAREQARGIVCISNMKQQATAVQMYVQDFDETMPYGGRTIMALDGTITQITDPNDYWSESVYNIPRLLGPYIKNTQIFRCADETVSPTGTIPYFYLPQLSDYAKYNAFPLSYWWMFHMHYPNIKLDGCDSGAPGPVSLAQIEYPAQKIMMDCGMDGYEQCVFLDNQFGSTAPCHAPHGAKFIQANFADGHARKVAQSNISKETCYDVVDWVPIGKPDTL